LIGERAMFLLQVYSRIDLPSLRRIVSGDKITDGGGTVALTVRDKRSLVALVWANALEQNRYAEGTDAELNQLFKETSHLLSPQSEKDIRSLLSPEH
jgi:type III secretory pathway lipoprotein EscJ